MVQLMANPAMKETDQYLEKFERFEAQAKQPAWVFPLRKAGIARFAELGFPTLQQEDWRFTNVAPIAKLPFKPVFQVSRDGLTPGSHRGVHFRPAGGQPAGVRQRPFRGGTVFARGRSRRAWWSAAWPRRWRAIRDWSKKHLARYAQGEDNPFAALNAAFFQDGGFIYVPAGRRLEAPVHLLFISTAKEAGATSHPRNLIIAEKASQVTVLESYVSIAEAAYFTNAVTELVLGEGAVVEH